MIYGVILAAGLSSRMGTYKPLLPIGDTVFIEKLIAQMQAAGAEKIIIVTGHCHAELEEKLRSEDVCFVFNENYESTQMLDSVKLALQKIQEINAEKVSELKAANAENVSGRKVLLSPADVVMSPQWVFDQLAQENADFAGPDYQGKGGHPVLIGSRLFDFILNYEGDGGLAGAIAASGAEVKKIPVDDPNVILDADTHEEYGKVLRAYKSSPESANRKSFTAGTGGRQNKNLSSSGQRSKQKHIFTVSCIALAAAILISILLGRYTVYPSGAWQVFLYDCFGIGNVPDPNLRLILANIRIPRVLLACMVGAALSAAGATYQGVLQNAIASPDILGASSGAAFGAALAILLRGNSFLIMVSAFAFSMLAVLLACLIARKSKGRRILLLVLAGMTVGALFTAGTSYLQLVADPASQLGEITYWLMGSLSGAKKSDLLFAGIPMLIGFLPLLLIRWRMNILSLGDDEARSLGVEPERLRMLTILCATLLTAAAVSVSGMIGWVGLVIPHLCRRIVGDDFRKLLPMATVAGATFLLIVDDLARNLLATEIPIGILTAVIGAPFFIFLLLKGGDGQ